MKLIEKLEKVNPLFYQDTYFLIDNLSSHTSKFFINAVEKKKIKIILTSPYSPELNPVELLFNSIK